MTWIGDWQGNGMMPMTPHRFFAYRELPIPLPHRQSRLSRRQSRHRHAERRATDIIQADHVAELDAIGIATVFAADTQFQVWIGGTTILCRHAYQLAHAVAVERLERVHRQNFHFALDTRLLQAIDVLEQELALSIVAAETKGRLRQIVGAEAEEIRHFSDLTGGQ